MHTPALARTGLAFVLATVAFAPTAAADKFYFGPADQADKMVEGEADFVEGVLLEEKDGIYRIRIEGGEMELAKELVTKIERDGLTVAALEQREGDAAQRLAEANANRSAMLAAEADARLDAIRSVRAAEASMATAAAEEAAIVEADGVYDPVLDVVVGGQQTAVAQIVRNELGGVIRRQVQRQLRALRQQLRGLR